MRVRARCAEAARRAGDGAPWPRLDSPPSLNGEAVRWPSQSTRFRRSLLVRVDHPSSGTRTCSSSARAREGESRRRSDPDLTVLAVPAARSGFGEVRHRQSDESATAIAPQLSQAADCRRAQPHRYNRRRTDKPAHIRVTAHRYCGPARSPRRPPLTRRPRCGECGQTDCGLSTNASPRQP